jgi:dUTP pyrophosphatase
MIQVKVVNKSVNPLPVYADPNDSGMDLRANIEEAITLLPLERKLVPTGLFIQLPEGYEAQVRPRSGLALKHGISVCNTPGTIDAGYRNEIGVVLINLSNEPFVVNPGDRIAQMVFKKYEKAELIQVESLDMTNDRGGGYGHSGVK